MAKMSNRLMRWIWGTSNAKEIGFDQTLKGLREGKRDDLYIGMAVSALAYLQRSKPKKELIHRQTVPEGAAVVIHHKKSGNPRLEIIKPSKKDKKKASK